MAFTLIEYALQDRNGLVEKKTIMICREQNAKEGWFSAQAKYFDWFRRTHGQPIKNKVWMHLADVGQGESAHADSAHNMTWHNA